MLRPEGPTGPRLPSGPLARAPPLSTTSTFCRPGLLGPKSILSPSAQTSGLQVYPHFPLYTQCLRTKCQGQEVPVCKAVGTWRGVILKTGPLVPSLLCMSNEVLLTPLFRSRPQADTGPVCPVRGTLLTSAAARAGAQPRYLWRAAASWQDESRHQASFGSWG